MVGMKKLAPYRDDGGMTRPNFAKLQELKKQRHVPKAARQRTKTDRGIQPVRESGRATMAGADRSLHASAQMPGAAIVEPAADGLEDDEQLRQRRLDTYAPLTLRRAEAGQAQASRTKHRKTASPTDVAGVQSSAGDTNHMTRAQKKNLRRTEKRRMRRSTSE